MIYATNKKVRFDYDILETYEAGLALEGTEVKSVRANRASLTGGHAIIRGGEAWLVNVDIPAYQKNNAPAGYDSSRTRKLLLKKSQIEELIGKTEKTGLTIVPLSLYNKSHRIKLELGLARHKKSHDKRATIRKRDTEREIGRTLKR